MTSAISPIKFYFFGALTGAAGAVQANRNSQFSVLDSFRETLLPSGHWPASEAANHSPSPAETFRERTLGGLIFAHGRLRFRPAKLPPELRGRL